MKTYAINLIVDTKNKEVYDKVALNKFPIIIQCKTEAELKDILSSKTTIEYVNKMIKAVKVLETAEWMIRSVYENGEVRELIFKVTDTNKNNENG